MGYKFNPFTGTLDIAGGGGAGGDVVGPASSVDNAIVRFDGTTGKLIQDYTSNAPTITDTGEIRVAAGSATVPSISFSSDTDLGFYRIGANQLGIAAGGGTYVTRYSTNTITHLKPVYVANGTVALPSYSFSGMTNGGLYRDSGTNELRMSIEGADTQSWKVGEIEFHVDLTNTQGQTLTESFGAGQTVTKANCAVFGAASQTTGQYASGFGWYARSLGNYATSMGANTYSTTAGTALGYGAKAGANSLSLGYSCDTFGRSASIAIGRSAVSTANNQLVIGGPTSYRTENAYFGAGVTSSTAYDFYLHGTGGLGTDKACGNFYMRAGAGTGTGAGGHLIFQTAAAGTTGSALNTFTTQLELTDDGNVIMANLPTSASGLPTGALWNNSGVINIA